MVAASLPHENPIAESGLKRFLDPAREFIAVLDGEGLSHQDRFQIGLTILLFGDPRDGVGLKDGLPDIEWIPIPGGEICLENVNHVFTVKPFLIAKYPVTNAQFQSFVDDGGYGHAEFWQGIEEVELQSSTWQEPNAPRETVSWVEVVAFCNWLSARTGQSIRLPAEWEWQQAATGGNSSNIYPWGKNWDATRCNSGESRLNRTTPVGIYPQGATLQGAMDIAGNVWEWCLNTYENPQSSESVHLDDLNALRVIWGGSWFHTPGTLRSSPRIGATTDDRNDYLGFRLAQDIR